MSINKGQFSLVYSINTLSVIPFCARQRNNAYSSCEKIDFPSSNDYLPNIRHDCANDMAVPWQYPGPFSVHMINKCVL